MSSDHEDTGGVDQTVESLTDYENPVVTGGTRTQLHAPNPTGTGPRCYGNDWTPWKVVELAKFEHWRDYCDHPKCRQYKREHLD